MTTVKKNQTKIICPDCKIVFKFKQQWIRDGRGFMFKKIDRSMRLCPIGDKVTRRYCEDCALIHLEKMEQIKMDALENPEFFENADYDEFSEYDY